MRDCGARRSRVASVASNLVAFSQTAIMPLSALIVSDAHRAK